MTEETTPSPATPILPEATLADLIQGFRDNSK